MREIPSARFFVSGNTGSGKSHFLRTVLLPRAPRCLVIDTVGEWERHREVLSGQVVVARSVGETVDALRGVASVSSWSVLSQIVPSDFQEVAGILVPEQFSDSSPVFSRLVGGMALVSDELDGLFSHAAPREVFSVFRRGRHVGLSVFGATQSPSSVDPLVRGMSRWLVLCHMHEINSVRYFEAVVPPDPMAYYRDTVKPCQALVYDAEARTAVHLVGERFERPVWRWSGASGVGVVG